MSQRRLIHWTLRLAVTLAIIPLSVQAGASNQSHPHIVVFLVDDMGLMDTSVPMLTNAEGKPEHHPLNDWYRTPNIERLAEQGIRFSNFYAQNTCSPTRATIMSGQNAARHRTTAWIKPTANNRGTFGPPEWNWTGLKKDDVTLPHVLQGAGYRTLMVGKGHFGPNDSEGADPLNLGFDFNVGGSAIGHPGSFYGKKYFGKGTSHPVPHLEKYHGQDIFLTEALTLEANALVEQAVNADKPFYLYMSHYAVHAPFNSDPRFAANYTNSKKSKNAKAFATLVEGMDKSLGDILDQLDALGVAEDTFIIFLGDNGSDAPLGPVKGYSSSAPLRGKKATEFEGGTRVPFVAGWAKVNPENKWQKNLPVARGQIQMQIGSIDDVFPTVLALAGVEIPAGHVTDGFDLKTQMAGKQNAERGDSFLMHFPHEHRRSQYVTTLVKGDWKLIYHYNPETPERPEYELYNLAEDHEEKNNLAKSNPEKLDFMVRTMTAELKSKNALYPVDASGNELKPRAM